MGPAYETMPKALRSLGNDEWVINLCLTNRRLGICLVEFLFEFV